MAGLNAAEAFVTITANAQPFNLAMDKVKARLSQVGQSMTALSGYAQKFLLITGGVLGLAVKEASDFGETTSKFEAVFKDQTAAAQAWADSFAAGAGRSKSELMAFMAQIQSVSVALGFSRKEGLGLSETITQLAVDLASFNNMDDSEALQALQSGILSGEAEPMKRFGVILNDAALDAELMKMGIKGGSDAASEAQKVIARLNITMRATKDAQGDAARTSDSMANQFKALKASLQELAIELGNAFIPYVKEAVGWVKQYLPPIKEWIKNNSGLVTTIAAVAGGVAAFFAVLVPLGSVILGVVLAVKGLIAVFALLFSPIGLIIAAIAALGTGLVYLIGTGDTFSERMTSGFFKIVEVVAVVAGAIVRAWAWIQDKVFGVLRFIVQAHLDAFALIGSAIDWITGGATDLEGFFDGLKDDVDGIFDAFDDGIDSVDEFGKTLMNADAEKMREAVGKFLGDMKDKFSLTPKVDSEALKKQFEELKAPDLSIGGISDKAKDKANKDKKLSPVSAEEFFRQDLISRLVSGQTGKTADTPEKAMVKSLADISKHNEAIKMYAKAMRDILDRRLKLGYQ